MNINLIRIIAFLFGLFIIISIYIIYNFVNKEHFENDITSDINDYNEISENSSTISSEDINNNNNNENNENNENNIITVNTNVSENQNENIDEMQNYSTEEIMNSMKNIIASSKNENLIESVLPNTNTEIKKSSSDDSNTIGNSKCYSHFRSTNIFNHGKDLYNIPYIEKALMHINTYNENFPKISKEKNMWFDEINNKNDIPGIEEENNRKWFETSEPIINDRMIKYEDTISSANINNIQLSGPIGIKFSNNNNNTLEPFSIFFITKIKNLGKQHGRDIYNSLFDLPLGSIIDESGINDDSDPNSKYKGGIISLMIKEELNKNKNTCNLTIRIRFGDDEPYDWSGIDTKLILNKNILIGLIYDGNNIKIILDNLAKSFKYKGKNEVNTKLILGSTPLIINKKNMAAKQENINMELFSFIFYNKVLDDRDIDLYIKYNNYHINKIHNLKENNKFIKTELDKCNIEYGAKIDHLQNKLINKEKELDNIKKEYNNILIKK